MHSSLAYKHQSTALYQTRLDCGPCCLQASSPPCVANTFGMWVLVFVHASVSSTVFQIRFAKRSVNTWRGDSKSHDFVDTTSFLVCSRHWHTVFHWMFSHEASHRRWTQIQFHTCLARFIFLVSDAFPDVPPVCAHAFVSALFKHV